jgi:hypothetical protein
MLITTALISTPIRKCALAVFPGSVALRLVVSSHHTWQNSNPIPLDAAGNSLPHPANR